MTGKLLFLKPFLCLSSSKLTFKEKHRRPKLTLRVWNDGCYCLTSGRGHTTAQKTTESMNSYGKTQEYIKGKSTLFIL